MPAKKSAPPQAVVRMNKTTHDKIKSIMKKRSLDAKKPVSMRQVMEDFISLVEKLERAEGIFYATKLYADIAEARGAAIVEAVRSKTSPQMPRIVAVIGDDTMEN